MEEVDSFCGTAATATSESPPSSCGSVAADDPCQPLLWGDAAEHVTLLLFASSHVSGICSGELAYHVSECSSSLLRLSSDPPKNFRYNSPLLIHHHRFVLSIFRLQHFRIVVPLQSADAQSRMLVRGDDKFSNQFPPVMLTRVHNDDVAIVNQGHH